LLPNLKTGVLNLEEHNLKKLIELRVNGVRREISVSPNELLLNVLRDRLGLTGTKYGCGIGECGACTVLLDGQPVLACLTLAMGLNGSEIVTIEGISKPDGLLHPAQEAFIENGAVQCGFCTPGMIVMAKALLDENPHPSEKDVRDHIRGNLCRCTGYTQIVEAILNCSKEKNVRERNGD